MKRKLSLILIVTMIFALLMVFASCNNHRVSISFESNGGSEVSSIFIGKDGSINLPNEPQRDGYSFDGWYFDTAFTEPYSFETATVKIRDFILYAKWIKNGLVFTQINHSYAVTGFNGNDESVTIPSTYKTLKVTTIATNAFLGKSSLFSVTIPSSITAIHESAFNDCYFLTISTELSGKPQGWHANWNEGAPVVWNNKTNSVADDGYTYFTKDNIRYAVRSDGSAKIVRYNGNSSQFNIPSTVNFGDTSYSVKTIGKHCFNSQSNITGITIPDSVEHIEDFAFAESKMKSIALPGNLKSIGRCAFVSSSNLTHIFLPSSVLTIGSEAFDYCASLVIYTSNASKKSGWDNQWRINTLANRDIPVYWNINATNYTTLSDVQYVVQNDKAIVSKFIGNVNEITIPSRITIGAAQYDVTSVGDIAFARNNSIQKIILPLSVSKIGYASFANCSALNTFNIHENIVNIGAMAFSQCDSLNSITIPASVTYIGADIFDGCDSLVINCEAGNKLGGWSYDWNYENGSESSRIVNWGVNNIKDNPDYNYVVHNSKVYLTSYKGSDTDISIPEKIAGMDVVSFGNIFQGNENLLSISIPETILRISDYAFYKCFAMTSVELPSSVLSIGEYAFAGTVKEGESMSLEVVFLSYEIELETIGNNAFAFCTKLKSFNIPPSLYKIGNEAFYNCYELDSIVLRNNVTQIGKDAFYNCDNVTIYCEMGEDNVPANWSKDWNSTNETTLWNQETDQKFTVNVYYQNICDDEFTLFSASEGKGAVGSTVTANAKTINHFVFVPALSTVSGTVEMGGTLQLSLYYTRKSYTVTFSANTGELISGDLVQSVRYGGAAVLPEFSKLGYHYISWSANYSFISANVCVQPVWTPNLDTQYQVLYYFENLENDNYSLDSLETLNLVGVTDTIANHSLKDFEHYQLNESLSTMSGNIAPDGSLVLKFYYSCVKYMVTFESGGGNIVSGSETQSIKYGNAADAPVFEKVGYVFNGFDQDISFISSDLTVTAKWAANTDTRYSVLIYFENINDSLFTLDEEKTLTYFGTTDEEVIFNPETISFDHFVFNLQNSTLSGIIAGDNSLALKLYFNRALYNVTFDGTGGTLESGNASQSVKYGANAVAPVFTLVGYTLDGWDKSFENISAETLISAVWAAKTNTEYKVLYYFENVSDDNFTLSESLTTALSGTTASSVTLEDFTVFPNFNFVEEISITSGTILADGSLELKLYYIRERYTVSFDSNGGVYISGEQLQTIKYCADATAPVYERLGYDFTGFDKALNLISKNTTIYAQWSARNDTAYRVEYYFENHEDEEFSLDESKTQNLTGVTDSTAQFETLPAFEHHNINIEFSTLTGNIDADGSLVLKLYYNKNRYTVEILLDGGTLIEGETTQIVKYGHDAVAPEVQKVGYTQNGWSEDFENIEADIEILPVWIANTDTPYYVYVYLQNLNDDKFTINPDLCKNYVGTTDTIITITPPVINHYTYSAEDSTATGNIKGDGMLFLTLYYTRNIYSVEFTCADGEYMSGELIQNIKYGGSAVAPVFSKTGYHIGSWSKSLTNISENIEPYPIWAPNTDTKYTVEFYFQNVLDDDYIIDNAKTLLLEGTTDANLLYDVDEILHFVYNAEISVNSGTVAADGTLVLKLYYDREIYEVTFLPNGGEFVSGEVLQSVRYGDTALAPGFSRAGYTQDGWNYEFDNISSDLEISPVWIARSDTPYVVYYYFENLEDDNFTLNNALTENKMGTTDEDAVIDPLSLATFLHFGLNFELSDLSLNINGDGSTALNLYFDRAVYAVTFDGANGNLISGKATQYIKYGGKATGPVFVRAGYTFVEWDSAFDLIENNLTVTAVWSANTNTAYCVKYYFENIFDNDFTLNDLLTENLTGTTDTLAQKAVAPSFENFVFESSISEMQGNIHGNGSLELKLYYSRVTFTVTFSANGGTLIYGDEIQTIKHGAYATAVEYEYLGYTQTGWNVDFFEVTADLNVYPIWEANDNLVEFNANGGTGSMADLVIKTDQSALLTPNAFTRVGFNFLGWATNPYGEVEYVDGATYDMGPEGIYTLYAVWDIIVYNISYQLNGGTQNSLNLTTYTVETPSFYFKAPTYRGYSFSGFFSNAEYSGLPKTYVSNGSIGNIIIYAKWTADSYAISYNLFGGQNNEGNPSSYTIETANITLLTPTREGCTFNGWYDSQNNLVTTIKTNLLSNYSLHAVWNFISGGVEYTITDKAIVTGFSGTNETITIDGTITVGGVQVQVLSIGGYAFNYASSIKTVVINEGILSIGDNAFEGCSSLQTVSLPSTLSSIGSWAFYDCLNLKYVLIPSSVTAIGESAFANCSVMIAYSNAQSAPIGWNTSWNSFTTGIVYFNISDSNFVETSDMHFVLIGGIARLTRYIGNAQNIVVPSYVTFGSTQYFVEKIEMWAFANCDTLKNVSIPNSVTAISGQVFYGCSSLEGLTLPFVGNDKFASGTNRGVFGYIFGNKTYTNAVETTQTFKSGYTVRYYLPSSLTSVTVTNITELPYGAFSGCTKISSLTVSSALVTVSDFAFKGMTSLSQVSLGSSLQSIGACAFQNCSTLTAFTISESVTQIGASAFYNCSLLTITCEIYEVDIPVGWDEDWNIDNLTVVWLT